MDTNIVDEGEKKTDDIDEVFASAPHTLSQRMFNQRLAGVPMEVRAVAAAPDAVTGGITLWTSTQIRTACVQPWPACCACPKAPCG